MEFTLSYRGKLRGHADARTKHELRRIFHKQMKELWDTHAVKMHREQYEKGFYKKVGSFTFVPLVTSKFLPIAELNITMLRPESPGSVLTQGGDIDNRLKTLFDALRMPSNVEELGDQIPQADEMPYFYSVLEDDNLVTKVSVQTDRFLDQVEHPLEVLMLIQVNAKVLLGG